MARFPIVGLEIASHERAASTTEPCVRKPRVRGRSDEVGRSGFVMEPGRLFAGPRSAPYLCAFLVGLRRDRRERFSWRLVIFLAPAHEAADELGRIAGVGFGRRPFLDPSRERWRH